jgi:hypothetical protein
MYKAGEVDGAWVAAARAAPPDGWDPDWDHYFVAADGRVFAAASLIGAGLDSLFTAPCVLHPGTGVAYICTDWVLANHPDDDARAAVGELKRKILAEFARARAQEAAPDEED